MTSPEDLIARVSQRVERFVDGQRAEYDEFGGEALTLIDAGARACAGGKRLRARFCAAGWSAVSGVPAVLPDAVVTVSAALEVFQAAALVHDDIIDNSDTRRGSPSVHRHLEGAHRDLRWAGDAATFGRSGAVLLGDLLVAWSDDLLEEGLAGTQTASAVRTEYARMRRDVTVGQFLDVAEEAAYVTAPADEHAERALRIASLKSARYSIQQPLVIGAALAGADAAQLDALRAFGHPIGLAFQLRDDILGVFGDSAVTGKPSGDDLREGKRTLLIAYTRETLDRRALAEFDALMGEPSLDEDQVAALQRTIVASGARDRVEGRITAWVAEAAGALDGAALDAQAVAELHDLAQVATARAS